MKLIDTNIIIYSAYPNYAHLRPLVMDSSNYVSAIAKVETLGFHGLLPKEKIYFENVFRILKTVDVDNHVIEKTIEIRQQQKMDLGDSLIAATALVNGLEIYTRNVKGFQKIPGLTVVNPV